MIPKDRRIKTSLFRIFRNNTGKTFRGAHVTLRARRAEDDLPSRFAIIVSKKIAKTAVSRNAIRRKVYSALDPLLPTIIPGLLCFLYPAREVEVLRGKDLKLELQTLFEDAKILK